MQDVNTLTAMADLSQMNYPENPYRAWIGLYDDVNSWRWSLADAAFYKPEEVDFRNWSFGEPNNVWSVEHCALMYFNASWNDYQCEQTLWSVCSDVRGSNVTFVLLATAMSWTQAQSYCRTHYTDLASVRNMAENQRVAGLLTSGQTAWIGLFRDSWTWFGGSTSSFRYWKNTTNEPNNSQKKEECVAADFSTSGQWEDWNCDYKRAFICYSVVSYKRVVKVRLEKQSSSLNLNDPAVMEDILKQFEQKLKDKGLNGAVRLSWVKQPDGNVFHEEKTTEEQNNPECACT